jgi:hypothetical protein
MNVMSLGRLSAPRFRTSSATKLMAAVRGLYMSSMMSARESEHICEFYLGSHFHLGHCQTKVRHSSISRSLQSGLSVGKQVVLGHVDESGTDKAQNRVPDAESCMI